MVRSSRWVSSQAVGSVIAPREPEVTAACRFEAVLECEESVGGKLRNARHAEVERHLESEWVFMFRR